ncbi:WD40 repeat-like protein [Hesseltinella vesiculosa]|uniref:WD40 repeat-like protein n=1 Tax=Hesseltinella vesiculosa TaxID=101127 RepID=A0A1X2GLK2_9FUNG|nr:WD40 repeat-like protein [Hesseltinella vesiculosa]
MVSLNQSGKSTGKPKKTSQNHSVQRSNFALSLAHTAGGDICQTPISFTTDSRYFFSGVGSAIKIYSIATGAVVKVLSRPSKTGSHTDKITGVLLNPLNPLQLISVSLDGTIKLWDYNDEVLLRTFDVEGPITQLVLSPTHPELAYILLSSHRSHQSSLVCQYHLDLSSTYQSENVHRLRVIAELDNCHNLAVSNDDTYLAMATRFHFYIWPVNRLSDDVPANQLRSYTVREGVTKLAFNPVKNYLAVGQRTGRISFYHCFTDETKEKPIVESHHWHYKPVESLQFMVDGNYLLSGGSESVLVAWQLETGFRRYFPRVGGSIRHITISPDHKHFCLSVGNNSIRFINSVTQEMDQVVQGVQQTKTSRYDLDTASFVWAQGMLIEPHNQYLVLNASAEGVQFYDGKMDKHVLDLEVIPNANNSRGSSGDRGHISFVSFLPNGGEWMATVDTRDDKINTQEIFLKFWRWDHDQQTYVLHTRVDSPHHSQIASCCFHPSASSPMVVTTSTDKSFKIWAQQQSSSSDDLIWTCRSVGMYRDLIPSAAAFSPDGSMLVVAFGAILTIWDPTHNTVQASLCTPESDPILSLAFVSDSPYLVARSATHLFVWNLLSCTVWWSYQMNTKFLSVDPTSSRFAVVTCDQHEQVVVFEPSSPRPLLVHTLETSCLGMTWQLGELNNQGESRASENGLVCLLPMGRLQTMTIVKAGTNVSVELEADAQNEKNHLSHTDSSKLLDSTFGKRQRLKGLQVENLQRNAQSRDEYMDMGMSEQKSRRTSVDQSASAELLSAPSHVLPALESMFDVFMESLMKVRNSEEHMGQRTMDWTATDTEIEETARSTSFEVHPKSFAITPLPSLDQLFNSGANSAMIPAANDEYETSSDDADSEDDVDDIEW